MTHYHSIGSKDAVMYDMYRINSEVIEEWNAIPPAKPKESTCKDDNHRKQVDHKIDKQIARFVAWQLNQHFTRM